MIAQGILLALLPIVAIVALSQSRRLSAIIGMGLLSFMFAAVYLLMRAPDVAITEATIGAALVTAIYILAIRRTGRLVVVADEVPGLIAREGAKIVGLEYDILDGFARAIGLDLSVQFVPLRRVRWLISHGEADIGAGGLIANALQPDGLAATPSHLETGVFSFAASSRTTVPGDNMERTPDYEGYFNDLISHAHHGMLPSTVRSLDLARVLALGRTGIPLDGLERREGSFAYAFLISEQRRDLLRDLSAYLEALRKSGQLQELVGRHFT